MTHWTLKPSPQTICCCFVRAQSFRLVCSWKRTVTRAEDGAKCNIWPTPSGEDGLESICHSCKRDRNGSIRQGPLLLMTLCLWSTLEYQDRPGLSVVLPVYTRAAKKNVSEVWPSRQEPHCTIVLLTRLFFWNQWRCQRTRNYELNFVLVLVNS